MSDVETVDPVPVADTTAAGKAIGTSEIKRRLFAKYHGADFAILMEVRNGAGFQSDRSADALGIGLWPSRGCSIHGFEIKASRADWLRELKDGAKAEAFFAYCDFWHVVVGDSAIVKEGELPPGWGLLVPHGDKLRETVPAKQNSAVQPMPRTMLAAWIKRASQQAPLEETLKKRYDLGIAAGVELGESRAKRQAQRDTEDVSPLRAAVERFLKATGIDIRYLRDSDVAKLATAYKSVQADTLLDRTAAILMRNATELESMIKGMRERAQVLTESPEGTP